MRSIGKKFIIIGLVGLIQWHLSGNSVADSQGILIVCSWFLFQGIYSISSQKDVRERRQMNVSYKNLLGISCVYCFFIVVICSGWREILWWRLNNPGPVNLSHTFAMILGNNLSWLQSDRPNLVTKIFRIIYSTGYLLPFFIPVVASIVRRRYKQAWQYLLSGHVLQVLIITPIFLLIQVEEVWYITGIPDGMLRTFASEAEGKFIVSWCFPSMHTSIAAASLLVALKEPYQLFKWLWSTYCVAIIISTVWLGIHWSIDVIAGIGVAFVSVYWTNCIIYSSWFQRTFLHGMEKKRLITLHKGER